MEASSATKWLCLCMVLFFSSLHSTECMNVTYDRKALIIRGQRRILFSGSIHYPRSTPQMWEGLIQKAKDGGLDAIDTYVFWDVHEPSPGTYNFEGRYDLVGFIKLVQKAGLYVHLRIGPYICGEWNFGGFPVWLKFIPGIAFRTNNEPFKAAMKKFTQKIVQMMKDEELFESQGGPIIISQIENEYWPEEGRFGKAGKEYMLWAANMAVAMDTGVPWVMCKQDDAPDPVMLVYISFQVPKGEWSKLPFPINTCNGFYCNKFSPNQPYKPTMWTEAWTGWFDDFGGPVHTRPVQDLAVAVARFIQKGGSFVNYYMYHGGTNFGRSAGGPFITTSYDYDAPIDEYGLIRQPKYGHLQDLHKAVKLCEKVLITADPNITILGHGQAAYVFTSRSGCAAFLENTDRNLSATVKFNGMIYDLPRWSISILPDCKTVAYNTAKVRVQPSRVEMVPTNTTIHSLMTFNERVPAAEHVEKFAEVGLLDQLNITRDDSDYLWYTTTIDISPTESFLRSGELPVLSAESTGDGMYVYINGHFSGWAYGSQESAKFKFSGNVKLKAGKNTIALLSFLMGLPNNGPNYEKRSTGILGPVVLSGLNGGNKDLTHQNWSYKVGPKGESMDLATSATVLPKGWTKVSSMESKLQPLTWYKGYFDAPIGDDPLALDMLGMGKGQMWVNGNNIGRYWNIVANGNCSACDYSGSFRQNKCHIGCGHPTQKWYHLPRSWLKPAGNSLVVFEEIGGYASKIYIVKRLVRND